MDIKTKYNIFQEVYFMEDNKVCQGSVSNITASAYSGNVLSIEYTVSRKNGKSRSNMEEKILYGTKKELLTSL